MKTKYPIVIRRHVRINGESFLSVEMGGAVIALWPMPRKFAVVTMS